MQKQNAQSIGNIFNAILANTWLGPAMERVDVFQTWEKTVGVQAAKATARQFFKDGILTVTLTSSSLRSHLYFQVENIRREMNRTLSGTEETPVRKIILR